MVPPISPAIWPNGSTAGASSISVAHRITTDAGQDRALASDAQKPSLARKLLSTGRPRGRGGRLRRALQSRPLPRKPPQSHPRGRLLRTRPNHPPRTGKDQTTDDRQSPLAAPRAGRLTSKPDDPEPPLLNPAPRLKLSDDGHWPVRRSRCSGWTAARVRQPLDRRSPRRS